MFEPGDKVVHQRHGAGTVIEYRTLTFEGKDREYFCIQMNDDRHTLMIPVDSIDEDEIRTAMDDTSVIKEVMYKEPDELSDNYRARQAEIRDKLKTRNPRKLAQALRDLAWLERIHKLTNTDTRLRDRLIKALAREVALIPGYNVTDARKEIQDIMQTAIDQHLANHPESVAN